MKRVFCIGNGESREGFDLEQHEQQLIMTAMQKAKHNVSEAARLLGISRAKLDYRLNKYY